MPEALLKNPCSSVMHSLIDVVSSFVNEEARDQSQEGVFLSLSHDLEAEQRQESIFCTVFYMMAKFYTSKGWYDILVSYGLVK